MAKSKRNTIANTATDVAGDTNAIGNENNTTGNENGQSSDSGGVADIETSVDENPEAIGDNRGENAESAAPIPQKRKRGRPSNAERAAKGENLDLKEKPKSARSKTNSVDTVAALYLTANNFAAMNANASAYVINESEAKTIAEPLVDVLALWGINLDGVSSPYARLIGAIIGVYGIRAMGTYMGRQAAKAASQQMEQAEPPPASPVDVPQANNIRKLNLA